MTYRNGDRVALKPDMDLSNLGEAAARDLPFDHGAVIEEHLDGDASLVVFDNGRRAFVRDEDLLLLRARSERESERRRLAGEKQLADRAEDVVGYYQPGSVDEAFAFGKRSAFGSHKQLAKAAFLDLCRDHPYPESLWRAYIRGWRKGQQDKKQKGR